MDNRNFDNINERFGYEIEYYRWRHHIKQEEFAKMLNLCQSSLSRIEMGKTAVDLLIFTKLIFISKYKSVPFFMLLVSMYPDNLAEMVKENYSRSVYKLFMMWVKYLEKHEKLGLKRHYSRDHFRVE